MILGEGVKWPWVRWKVLRGKRGEGTGGELERNENELEVRGGGGGWTVLAMG